MTPAALPAWLPEATLGVSSLISPLQGSAALAKARGMRQQAEANAFIGETRALQTATTMQEQLGDEMATLRATVAANGQGMDAGTLPFFQELRRTRLREGRIAIANERQGAADYRMQGQAATGQGRAAFMSGILGSGQSLFSLWDYKLGPREDSLIWNRGGSRGDGARG